MKTYLTLHEALQGVRDFTIDKPEGCPTDIFQRLRKQTVALDQWGDTLQAIYDADRGAGDEDTVGPELMQIAAGALVVFANSGFYDIGKDGTAARMALALLRDSGEPAPEGMAWPDPESDPPKSIPVSVPTPPGA